MLDLIEYERDGPARRWALTPSLMRRIALHPDYGGLIQGRVPWIVVLIDEPSALSPEATRSDVEQFIEQVEMRRHTLRVTWRPDTPDPLDRRLAEMTPLDLLMELEVALLNRGVMTRYLSQALYEIRREIDTFAPARMRRDRDAFGRCDCPICREGRRRDYQPLSPDGMARFIVHDPQPPSPPRPPSKLHPLVQQDERDRALVQEQTDQEGQP